MTGQKGAGSVAIPTLAFSSLTAFVTEAAMRGLGTNDLNAIRVQPHQTKPGGGVLCYTVSVTAFDDQHGCVLVLRYGLGCYGPPGGDENEAAATTAYLSIKKTIEDLAQMTTAMGEWVHDPVPSDMWHSWGGLEAMSRPPIIKWGNDLDGGKVRYDVKRAE